MLLSPAVYDTHFRRRRMKEEFVSHCQSKVEGDALGPQQSTFSVQTGNYAKWHWHIKWWQVTI